MKKVKSIALILCSGCLLLAQVVFADDDKDKDDRENRKNITKSQCVKDANNAHKLAIEAANEERKLAKLICDAGSPEAAACLQSCLQAKKDCLKPINDATEACYDSANAAFASSRASCKESAQCSGDCPGNAAFQECMIPVRIALFNANKACRLADDKAGRKACKSTYRACNDACKAD